MAVTVHRPGLHDERPQGKATEDEGKAIGGHNSNKTPKHESYTESYVNIWTGDYHLTCDYDGTQLYHNESNTSRW